MIQSYASASAALSARIALLDAGAGPGLLRVYAGTPPTSTSRSRSGSTLLAELVLDDPAFGAVIETVSHAEATAAAISAVSALADGDPSFADLTDSDGTVVVQLTVGSEFDSAELKLRRLPIQSGSDVHVAELVMRERKS